MSWITFELPAPLVAFGGIALASVLISLLPVSQYTGKPIHSRQNGAWRAERWAVLFDPVVLGVLFVGLFIGLLVLLHEIVTQGFPVANEAKAEWRFVLTKIAAFTAVLGAVVALPITLARLSLNREQSNISRSQSDLEKGKGIEAIFSDLFARREVTEWKDGIASNGWEDDITRRNGAIHRLGVLVEENMALQPRVDRELTLYLREMSREYQAEHAPEGASLDQIKKWARGLYRARSDMENAVQVLSRLPRAAWAEGAERLPDLRSINMQAFDLSGLKLQGANLVEAQLQGADLRSAHLQGADLSRAHLLGADLRSAQLQGANLVRAKLQKAVPSEAHLQGADLRSAQLQGSVSVSAKLQRANLSSAELQEADFSDAKLQGAYLNGAQLQGADFHLAKLQGAILVRAQFDADTNLRAATLRGAALRFVDLTDVPQIADHIEELFGDDTVTFPEGTELPERFRITHDSEEAFKSAWRTFQRSIGQDPENPA